MIIHTFRGQVIEGLCGIHPLVAGRVYTRDMVDVCPFM